MAAMASTQVAQWGRLAATATSSSAPSGELVQEPTALLSLTTAVPRLPVSRTTLLRATRKALRANATASRRSSAAPRASADVAADAAPTSSSSGANWVPLIPIETLPRGERRLVKAEGETVLLLWYKNEIYALENSSPAEGAYAEGLFNARLTQDGCIICPLTDSTFDLKTGAIKDWYPNNPIMRFLTRPLRQLQVYPVKIDNYQICVDIGSDAAGQSAEVVFARAGKAGETASDLAVDEVRMVVDESEEGFGFSSKNELINGRAAMIGFFSLLIIELVTGKGLLAATGFLDFLYRTVFTSGPILK